MGPFQFFRALLVLAVTPLLTLAVSVIALAGMYVFRCSPQSVQVLPHYWGKLVVWLSGSKVRVRGGEGIEPGRPYIFAANHQSQFDIFALQGFLGVDFRWLAKKELFQVPVFGPAMRRAGYIPVDRARGREAVKSLDEAAERIAAGTSVIIFPEGTRSPDGRLQPFKSGAMALAIKAGVPIVPVAIKGTHEILPKGRLLARSGKIDIRIGLPIDPQVIATLGKQELASRVHDDVARLLEAV